MPRIRLAVFVLVACAFAVFAEPATAGWRAPVPGEVTRGFDLGANPFEGGRHRGADLAAAAGATVRAPCGGTVAVAGRVGTSGGVVTVLCGRWRVSHMPLATIAVRPGHAVTRGAALGAVAASSSHAGLHLGVRRDGTRFGYVDPLRVLGEDLPPPAMVGPRPQPRPAVSRRTSPPRPAALPARPAALPARPAAHPARPAGLRGRPLAPWPAWCGVALVLAGLGLRWSGVGRRSRWSGAGVGSPGRAG